MITCLNVIRNNFKRNCNRRTGFIVNFVIPIIVVILGIFANSISKPDFTIGVMQDNLSTPIVKTLSDTDGITVAKANPDTVKIDLITGKYSAVIEFSKSDYKLFSIKNTQTNNQIKKIIDTFKTAAAPVNIEEVVGSGMSAAVRTIAFIVLFLMVTSTITASLMIKDKKSGTLKRYQYSPQKPASYILGNFIYNYLITFLQFLLSITFMQLTGITIGVSYPDLILMGVWLSGIATAFGTFISGIFQEEMYANLFASFIALILSLVGGTFISYENMPVMLQKISIISPFRWFIEITKNMENGMSLFHHVPQITVLSGMIIFLILNAVYRYKKTKVI